MAKALAMFSGGLDSALAVRLIQEQNVEVAGIHFHSVFTTKGIYTGGDLPAKRRADKIGLPLIVEDNSEDFLELVKAPKHGYGRNINPCIDCRIRNLNRSAHVMKDVGADFIITGEVVGQRPMSQNRGSLRLIEKETGLEGLLLRPLSAKLHPTTVPERRGWVAREEMLSLSGRSRKPQLALAKKYGVTDFSSPAGGCLVTDPGFAHRMRDLLDEDPDCDLNDVNLLKLGRHFRPGPGVRLVVGRDRQENDLLESLAREGDTLMEAATLPGPVSLIRGPADAEQLRAAASITLRYGKAAALPSAPVRTWPPGPRVNARHTLDAPPASQETIESLRIAPD